MINDLKAVLSRSSATVVQDTVGIIALAVTLVVGLNLPGFF